MLLRISSIINPFFLLAALVGFITTTTAGHTLADNGFKAGAARLEITPPLGTPIVGGWKPVPAAHIHDPLYVRVLVLSDGDTKLAFVVCDLLGVPVEVAETAKQRIHRQSGIPPSHVIITGTHTHSAGSPFPEPRTYQPVETLNDYQRFLVQKMADAVQVARNHLEPAKIGWGAASEPGEVFNRRWFIESPDDRRNPFGGVDRVRMNPPRRSPGLIKPAGPVDPEIVFISVKALDGRPLALLANYSLHYVGGIPPRVISADYFGVFSDRIQELLEADRQYPPFVGILTNGTSGDINNIDFSRRRVRANDFEQMRRVGEKIAGHVHRAWKDVEYLDEVELQARYQEIPLRRRELSDEMIAWAKGIVQNPKERPGRHRREVIYAQRVLDLAASPETLDFPLQAFRIGPVGIAAIPAEVFAEIGLEIKEKSPFETSFTLSLANGYLGYLPTVEQHELGGYETWPGTCRVEEHAAPRIVETLLGFFREMY